MRTALLTQINAPAEPIIVRTKRILECASVWIRNLRVLHVRIAYAILTRAMRKDADYRDSWQANIAMPIYDATRPSCTCLWDAGHESNCAMVKAHDQNNHHPMDIKLANEIANRLMRHLFGV